MQWSREQCNDDRYRNTELSGSILKRPITAPATLGMVDYQSTDHEQLMKRLRPAQSVVEVTYPTSRQHATWSLGDLPRTVACTMHQGSAVTSMDFHSAHHTLLLGVYADLLVAPISPSELGAGAGLLDIPIDPQAFVAELDGGLLGPIGPLGFGIYAVLLGPPIDGAGAGLPDILIDPSVFVAEIDGGLLSLIGPLGLGIYADMLGPPIDGAGAGLPDVLIDPLAFVIASGFHALYLESMVNCYGILEEQY